MEPSAVEGGEAGASQTSPSLALPPDEPAVQSESSPGGADQAQVKAAAAQGPSQPAASEQATCDDFHLMWGELEAYLTKRFSGGPQSLISLSRVVDHVKRQRLRVEELAFLIGQCFPDAPDVSLCMSLFLPDRTLIHAGNPAAAMCTLIQNMAPDKYAIFNSILKSCMAQKTQRGSRDILLHRMQLLFRGHPLVIRAIRKLLVQQFCIEKNGGVIRKDQAVELAKPFDDEPVQVHSAFRLAYQVGLSGGSSERARVLASNVLHLLRMYLSKRLAFSSFSHELDRAFSCFPSWFHVAGDIKRLILTISKEDIQTTKEVAKVVKLLAGRNAAACEDRRTCLRYLCDLFLNGVTNQSVALRIEIDHLISRALCGELPASLAMQRIGFLVARYPDCCEKLGVLVRLFRDLEAQKRSRTPGDMSASQLPTQEAGNEQEATETRDSQTPTAPESPFRAKSCTVGSRAPLAQPPIQHFAYTWFERQHNLYALTYMQIGTQYPYNSIGSVVAVRLARPFQVETASEEAPREGTTLQPSGMQITSAEVEALVRNAAELLCQHIAPCRFRSQDLMIQLVSYSWLQPIYPAIDDWNAGHLSKDDVVSALHAAVSADLKAVEVIRRLIVVLETRRGAGQGRAALTRQQYDSLPRNGSYRKLPGEWPASECSGRDALSWRVLNDRWALFPDSSESQARYMNRHEEALLSLADARYDWDLRIARLESCLNRLEAIGEALKRLPAMERKYCTVRPSFFGQVHIACFRRIFGANTEQVLSCLCASPLASLETIYSTLEFKLVQWKAMGEVLGAYWTSQEQPHYAGAIDFKKRFLGDKRGGTDVEELRAAEGRDSRSKSARVVRNDA